MLKTVDNILTEGKAGHDCDGTAWQAVASRRGRRRRQQRRRPAGCRLEHRPHLPCFPPILTSPVPITATARGMAGSTRSLFWAGSPPTAVCVCGALITIEQLRNSQGRGAAPLSHHGRRVCHAGSPEALRMRPPATISADQHEDRYSPGACGPDGGPGPGPAAGSRLLPTHEPFRCAAPCRGMHMPPQIGCRGRRGRCLCHWPRSHYRPGAAAGCRCPCDAHDLPQSCLQVHVLSRQAPSSPTPTWPSSTTSILRCPAASSARHAHPARGRERALAWETGVHLPLATCNQSACCQPPHQQPAARAPPLTTSRASPPSPASPAAATPGRPTSATSSPPAA